VLFICIRCATVQCRWFHFFRDHLGAHVYCLRGVAGYYSECDSVKICCLMFRNNLSVYSCTHFMRESVNKGNVEGDSD